MSTLTINSYHLVLYHSDRGAECNNLVPIHNTTPFSEIHQLPLASVVLKVQGVEKPLCFLYRITVEVDEFIISGDLDIAHVIISWSLTNMK